jgi:citrate synthase
LTIGGFALEQLAGERSFEWVIALLLDGSPPSEAREQALIRELAEARCEVFASARWQLDDAATDGMAALRGSIAALGGDQEKPVRVIAAVLVFAAMWTRARLGLAPLRPRATVSMAEDYLQLILGEASAEKVAALNTYWVSVIDHGLNASTFAARVVASTGSDLVSAVTAGIGALKGPLHGGAPGPVLDMLDAVQASGDAEAWLAAELEQGRRIMGMGHRIYKTRDPRAFVLERALSKLAAAGVVAPRLATAKLVEQAAAIALKRKYPNRSLQTNVEFYTAVLLDTIGLPRWAFASTFAVGRTPGWCAHVAEQRRKGRLIRPASLYVGSRHEHRSAMKAPEAREPERNHR